MKQLISNNIIISLLIVCLGLISNFSLGQIKRITTNSNNSHESFFVGHFNGNQKDSLISRSAIIVPRSSLKNSSGIFLKGILDSISFYMAEGCGYSMYNSTLKIYALSTKDSTIDSNVSDFLKYRNSAQLIFFSDEVKFPDSKNTLAFTTNHAFEYNDSNNIIILTEWIRPRINFCFKTKWYGNFVSDLSVMHWENSSGNFSAAKDSRFKIDVGLSINPNLKVCSNKSSFTLSNISGYDLSLHADSTATPLDIDLMRNGLFENIPSLKTRVFDSTLISGLLPGTQYTINSKDTCSPSDYTGFNFKKDLKTPCIYDKLDQQPYSQNFDGSGESNQSFHCWNFQNPSYGITNTSYSNSGNYVLWFYKYYNHFASSMAFKMTKDTIYEISYKYLALGTIEKFHVTVSTSPNPNDAGVFTDSLFKFNNNLYLNRTFQFKPTANNNYYIHFILKDPINNAINLYLDDVDIRKSNNCPMPVMDSFFNMDQMAHANFSLNANTVGLKMELTNDSTTLKYSTHQSKHTFNNLTPNSDYILKYFGICKDSTLSNVGIKTAFKTRCAADTLSIHEYKILHQFENWLCLDGLPINNNGYTYKGVSGNGLLVLYQNRIVEGSSILLSKNDSITIEVFSNPYYPKDTSSPNLTYFIDGDSSKRVILPVKTSTVSYTNFKKLTASFTAPKDGLYTLGVYVKNGQNPILDNLSVHRAISCNTITDLLPVTNITENSARLTWKLRDTLSTKSLIKLIDLYGNTQLLTTNNTMLDLSNLNSNSGYFVHLFTICGTDTGNAHYPIYFKTKCTVDTINRYNSFSTGFESPFDIFCFEFTDIDFEHHFGKTQYSFDQPVSGNGYIYSISKYNGSYVNQPSGSYLKSNRLYLSEGVYYSVKYDYLKFPNTTVSFLEILNEKDSVIKSVTINYKVDQSSGKIDFRFRIDKSGVYRVKLRMEDKFSIDNFSVSVSQVCEKISSKDITTTNLPDSIQIDYSFSNNDAQSINIETIIERPNQYKWNIPVKNNRARFTFKTDNTKFYMLTMSKKCSEEVSDTTQFRFQSKGKTIDSITNLNYWHTTFDDKNNIDESLFSKAPVFLSSEAGFPCVSGDRFLQLPWDIDETFSPLHHLDSGLNYAIRFLTNSPTTSSRNLTILVLSQDYEDTLLNFTKGIGSSAHYNEIFIEFSTSRSGFYFIKMIAPKGIKNIFIENFTYRGFRGIRSNNITSINQLTDTSIAVRWTKVTNNIVRYCAINLYPYEETNGGPILSDTISSNDTLYIFNKVNYNKEYSVKLSFLDSNKREYCPSSLSFILTKARLDTLRSIGSFFEEDFEKSKAYKFIPNGGTNLSYTTQPFSVFTQNTKSGLNSFNSRFLNKGIYLFKDSIYELSVNATSSTPTNTATFQFRDSISNFGPNFSVTRGFKTYVHKFTPTISGIYKFGFSNSFASTVLYDDFRISRSDTNSYATPILTSLGSNENWLKLSWNQPKIFRQYIIEKEIDGAITKDTISNLNDTIRTFSNLELEKKYNFKVYFNDSNTSSSTYKFISGHIADTITKDNSYVEDYENDQCLKRITQYKINTDFYRTGNDKKEGLYSLTFDYQISISSYQTVLAKVYLKANTNYTFSLDYKSSANNNLSILMNDTNTTNGATQLISNNIGTSSSFSNLKITIKPSVTKTYYILLRNTGTSTFRIYIDNVSIREVIDCSSTGGKVISFESDSIHDGKARLQVSNNFDARAGIEYTVKEKKYNTTPWTPIYTFQKNKNDTIFFIYNLNYSSQYSISAKAICQINNTSGASSDFYINPFCSDSIIDIDSTKAYTEDFEKSAPIPDCWIFSKTVLQIKPTAHLIKNSDVLAFPDNNISHAISKKFLLKSSTSYTLAFDYFIETPKDTIFYAIYDYNKDTIIISGFVNSLRYNVHSITFNSPITGPSYIRIFKKSKISNFTNFGCYIDNLSIHKSHFCITDDLNLISKGDSVAGKIKIGSNTQKNIITVVNTLNWAIDTFILPSSQSAFIFNFKNEKQHLFEIKSICNADTGRSVIYSATKEFKAIQPGSGWCENFKRLEDNHMQPGWSATGGRTVNMNPSIKVGECLGITNNPLTDDYEKQYTTYSNTRRVYYIQSPNFELDMNMRYNLNMLYYFSHGAFECCKYPWEVGLDSIHAELYDEVTKTRLRIGSNFVLSGDNISRTKSIDFIAPYSGKFKIRVYAHICVNKTSPPVNFLIDDFCIKEVISCNAPPIAKLRYDTITKQHALSWTQLSSAKSGYLWYMVHPDSNKIAFSGATRKASDTSQVLFDIEKNVKYKLYVRSNCSQPISDSAYNTKAIEELNLSAWSDAFSITTECLTEKPNEGEIAFDFEKNIGDIPSCWLKYSNNWSVLTPFEDFKAQNSKSFLFLDKSNFDSIATNKIYLTKDTAYSIKTGILTDGRKGLHRVSAWLIDEDNNQFFIGDFERNSITTTYIDRYLDFTPPKTGEYRIKLWVSMTQTKTSGPRGIAFDNLVIRKRMSCQRPVVISHDGLNKESISINLDSSTVSGEVIVQFRLAGNNFKYDTIKVVNNRINIDRKKSLNMNWSATSISNTCGQENEFSSEFIIPPMQFDSIRIKIGSPYFQDFNTQIEPLSAIYGWDYYMPTYYSIEKYQTPEMTPYDKGYLRLNGDTTSTISSTSYIGTPWFDLDKFEPYTFEFRLNKPTGNQLAYGIVSKSGDTTWLHPTGSYSSNWSLISDTFRTKSYGLHKIIFSPNFNVVTLGIDNLKIDKIIPTCSARQQAILTSIKNREVNFKLINSVKSIPIKWKIIKDISNLKADGIYSGIGFEGDSIRIQNLPTQSKYYVFTQRPCSSGDTSQWYECFQFAIDCEEDSLKLNLSKCENFENYNGLVCYINNSWSLSSQPVDNYNTTNGTTFLYNKSKISANLMSGYFLAKKDESMDVSLLLYSDTIYGIEKFAINLFNIDSSKTYDGIAFKDTIFKNKNYQTLPLRIPSDGLYRLSIDGLPKNNGFILMDDICITKTDRCLSPIILSSDEYIDSSRLHILKPQFTDSVSIDLWTLNRQGSNFLRTEYQPLNNASILLKNLAQDHKHRVVIRGFCSGKPSLDSSIHFLKTDCRVDTIKDELTFNESFENVWLDWSTGCHWVINKNIWEIDTFEDGYNSKTSLSKYNGTAPFYSKKVHILAGRQYEVSINQRVNGFGFVQEISYGLIKEDSGLTQIAKKTITGPTNSTFEKNSFIFSNDSNLDVRFFIASKGGNYVYFDDLSIKEIIPCSGILNSRIDSVSQYGAKLSWQNPKYPIKTIDFIVKDSKTWTTQKLDTTAFNSNTFAFNGLYPGKPYLLLSRSYCNGGDSSKYSDSLFFVTSCPVYSDFQFNQFGSLDYNDSNRYCWSFNNSKSDNTLDWNFKDSIFKEGVLVTDFNDNNGTQYLTVKGIKNGNMVSSSVNTPIVHLNTGNKLLHFNLTNNKPANSSDDPIENNSLYVILRDTSIKQIDTLFLFNGSLPNIWTNFSLEIPDKFKQISIQFNYLQNSDSTEMHALAIDGMRITDGKCDAMFKSDNLSNNSNNTLCFAKDSNLYIGKNDELAYVVHLKSNQGISLYHLNAKIGDHAYNLSDSFNIHNSNYFVTSASIYSRNNNARLDFVDSLKIAFSKHAFNALADSVSTASLGQISLKPEDLTLFFTSEKIDLDSRLIGKISNNKLDSLTFNTAINSGTFNVGKLNDKYLIGLAPSNLQNWLSISAYGRYISGAIESQNQNRPTIYPNPFDHQVIVQSALSPIDSYQLFDISGRAIVVEGNLKNTTQLIIDTTHLVGGVYTLTILINKKLYNYKLVKM